MEKSDYNGAGCIGHVTLGFYKVLLRASIFWKWIYGYCIESLPDFLVFPRIEFSTAPSDGHYLILPTKIQGSSAAVPDESLETSDSKPNLPELSTNIESTTTALSTEALDEDLILSSPSVAFQKCKHSYEYIILIWTSLF